ncbi:fimbrial protein [Entomohabitans teleogrylli]|uniref:fimbrial protein n=1 Tax=Entomohabitans teleogrylli TaxID=1384589 RepID=UPI00073D3051|nr:fimbrial protein [Entomohabitans teleogrylli]
MKMNKTGVLLITLLGMTPVSQALAVDGQIEFTGMITDVTCVVSVNNQGPMATITLPTISLYDDIHADSETPFRITLEGCTGPTLSTAYTYFEAGAGYATTFGWLNNKSGPGYAEHVYVEIARNGGNLQLNDITHQSQATFDLSDGYADYTAHYITLGGPVTAGDIYTVADYTIMYQ